MNLGKRRRRLIIGLIILGTLAITWVYAQGGEIRFGESVEGALSAGKSDEWFFTGGAGSIIALSAARTDGDLDPSLLLKDPANDPVAGTDAVQGRASLVQVRLSQSGTYRVQVSAAGQSSGKYRLTLSLTQAAETTATPAPTVQHEVVAGVIRYSDTKQGEITNAVYRQIWRFPGNSGYVVDIRMSALSGNLDPYLSLVSPAGDILTSNDSASGGLDAGILAFQLPFTGDYSIVARRAGATAGLEGKTAGRYELSIRLRGTGSVAQNTVLNAESTIQGRLNDSFPQAVYRLEFSGSVAINLDLNGANRLARVRLLTPSNDVLADFQGLSPLAVFYHLPDPGPSLLEVSAPSYDNLPSVDFSVSAYRLSADIVEARPLAYNQPRRSTVTGRDDWFFIARAGDIVSLDVTPDVTTLGMEARLLGPQDVNLYQGELGPGLRQPLMLKTSGLYEIEVRLPGGSAPVAYAVHLERLGAYGIPFDQVTASNDLGPLALNDPTEGTLIAGATDTRWLDATAGQMVDLAVSPVSGNYLIGLALQRPDSSFVDVQFSKREQPAVIQRALLDQTGRYRVLVFAGPAQNAAGATPHDLPYTLRYEDAGGGALQAGQRVKGIVSPSNGLAVWSVDVAAGALISARLTNLTEKAWAPVLAVIDPGGQIIAASPANTASPRSETMLLGVEAPVTGQYRIMVAGEVSGKFASYNLLSDVQVPFATSAEEVIRVSATHPPVIRYGQAAPGGPIRVAVADLINPQINADQMSGAAVQTIGFNTTVRGQVDTGQIGQVWRFTSGSNVMLQLRATSLSGSAGPNLSLWDRTGKLVSEQFHSDGPTTVLTYRVIDGSTYKVVVSMGLNGGRYTLALESLGVSDGALSLLTGTPILYGQTIQGEILSSEEFDSYYFLGSAGDVISVLFTRTTGTFLPALSLLDSKGVPVGQATNAAEAASASLQDIRLPDNGLYTVHAENRNAVGRSNGRYALYLGLTSGLRLRNRGGGIISPGATETGLLSVEDNNDTWLFQGYQGERVTFSLSGLDDLAPLGLRLMDTAGRIFAAQDSFLSQNLISLADVMLPGDGIYRVQVIGGGQTAGVYTLTWEPERERQVIGPLQYGQVVNGVFTAQRTFDTWVFPGTAGDVVSISLRYVRGDPFKGSFQLRAENGLPLATVADLGDGQGAHASVLLPFSGSYSLVVANPDSAFNGAGIYGLSVNLRESKARSAGTVIRYGEQGTGDLYVDDPQDTWIFGARMGDRVRITVQARDHFLKPALQLRSPAGEALASAVADDSAATAEARIGGTTASDFVIPADGLYIIAISGAAADGIKTTGSYQLALDYTPPPIAEIETLRYGESRPGLIANDRPSEFYMFEGQQGDLITAEILRESGANLSSVLELRTDDGVLLARADSNDGDKSTLKDFRLPRTGPYRLIATRYLGSAGQTEGRYNIRIDGTPEERPIRGTALYGKQAIGRLDDATPIDRLTFEGKAGDVVGITAHATSGDLDIKLALQTSTGEVLASNENGDGTRTVIPGVLLPADGTYMVMLSRTGTRTVGSSGNYELFVNRLYQVSTDPPPGALITYGTRIVGAVDAANAEARYTFSGNRGDEVDVQLLHQTDDAPPLLSIQDPVGTSLAEGKLAVGHTTIDRYQLPASGLYTIVVKRPINTQQPFSPFALTLNLVAASAQAASGGGIVGANQTVAGTFAPGEAAHYWLFEGNANQVITLNLLSLTSSFFPSAILIGPNGQGLNTVQVSESASSAMLEHVVLPSDGMYSVLILPGIGIGQYHLTLQLESTAPAVLSLAPGQVVSGTIDALSGGQRWTFDGRREQTVSARMLVTGGNLVPRLRLVSAEGQVLAEGSLERTPQGVSSAILAFPLSASGSYLILTDQQPGELQTAGTYRLLIDVDSPAGLTADAVAAQQVAYGQPVHSIIQSGATALWAFSGRAGDAVNVDVTANNAPAERPGTTASVPGIEIQDMRGRVLAEANGQDESMVNSLTLPADGRYVVALHASATLSYTLVIQRRQDLVPANPNMIAPRALVFKTPLQNGISADDLVDYWSFTADAGTVVQIEASRLNGNLRPDMALYGPSGYITAVTAEADQSSVTLGPVRLAEKGSYLLVMTRWLASAGRTAGGYRLVMRQPSGVIGASGGAIPVYGRAVTGDITADDDSDTWTIDGEAGTVIAISMTRLSGDLRPTLSVSLPGGQDALAEAKADDAEASISRVALPSSGQYTIRAGRVGSTTGGYRLVVRQVETAAQASVARAEGIGYGDQKSGELSESTPLRAWVFFGKAGERIIAEARPAPESALDPYLYLLNPDGAVLAADDNSSGGLGARLADVLLPGDGFYGVVVGSSPLSNDAGRYGAFTVTLQRSQPGATYQGQIDVGDEVTGTLTAEAPVQEWTFEITQAQNSRTIAASASSASVMFNTTLAILTQDGKPLAVSGPAPDGSVSVEAALPGPGRYAVLLSGGARGTQGAYRLRLGYALAPTGGGVLVNQQRGYGSIADADFTDAWRFSLDSAAQVTVTAARLSGDLELEVSVYGPDGALLGSQDANGARSVDIALPALASGSYTVLVSRAGGPAGPSSGSYTVLFNTQQ